MNDGIAIALAIAGFGILGAYFIWFFKSMFNEKEPETCIICKKKPAQKGSKICFGCQT